MKFTTKQVEQFREEGWLGVPQFWTEREIAAMRVELERFKEEGLLRNVSVDGDGQTRSQTAANLQLCPMYPHSKFFRAMPFAEKVAQAVGQLIGDPVILHLDQVFLKPAGHGAGTNWHQDNAYFRIPDPLQGTAMWTAVHDANHRQRHHPRHPWQLSRGLRTFARSLQRPPYPLLPAGGGSRCHRAACGWRSLLRLWRGT